LKTKGVVTDCATVLDASNEYKKKQDVISQFIDDRIVQVAGANLKKTAINAEFTLWHQSNYGTKGPNAKEVHSELDKRFGKHTENGWIGIRIHYELKTEVPNEDEIDDGL
jgi:phage/plasmid-associated DNA primase